uniref:GSEFLamide isoform 3 n=1 Tax=Homarus americanus TaxID=6706 RepID=A0A3S7UNF4_HOMAM|nr:GSEFLamide precursor isoform 3 [Homarus americanus]
MVRGWPCVVVSCVLLCCWCVLSAALPTHLPDELDDPVVKRLAGTPHESMIRYFLMAMSNPAGRYKSPQLLNRGVRRIGSEFLGKRSVGKLSDADNPRDFESENCSDDDGTEEEDLKKEQFSFTGQYDYDESAGENFGSQEDLFNTKPKRNIRSFHGGVNNDGLKNFFSMLMSKKMGSEFLGKRMGSEFLGKRAMGSEFLGKRAMGSEFLGKRALGSEFLGKRVMGSEFLGKRAMGSEFLGKRAMGSEFLGKRAMGSEFLGKRAMGSEFLGKRAMGSEFLGKRAMGSEFLGKRAMGSEFLGKRQYEPEFAHTLDYDTKRAVGSEFLG